MNEIIDADHVYYKELNTEVREKVAKGANRIVLKNVNGQRYIGLGVKGSTHISVEGVPGNDLGMFMDGLTVEVFANAQDGLANTMNEGNIIIHGDAGDVLGYGMRGGSLFIEGHVGYRVGIHMKAFKSKVPKIVIGGTARDFFGEYMAGGIMVLLGLGATEEYPIVGKFAGTGMHGGVIYIRGEFDQTFVGKEVKVLELDDKDKVVLQECVSEFCTRFGYGEQKEEEIMAEKFCKLVPWSSRPYGNIYVH